MPTSKPWMYLQNQFLNSTDNNYKKFLIISLFHFNILQARQADPFINSLLKLYQDVHATFVTQYNIWEASGGTQKKTTKTYEQLQEELQNTLARKWDIAVQGVFDDTTADYLAIFPQHRKPFQIGSAESRMATVAALELQLSTYPELAALYGQVNIFNENFKTAFANKDGKIDAKSINSDKVEAARVAAAWIMYADLGLSMAQYKSDHSSIESLFDVARIRENLQYIFTGHVAINSAASIVRRTLQPGDMFSFVNTGQVALSFFAASAKEQHTGTLHQVQPGATLELSAEAFGNNKQHPFINVLNTDLLIEGHFELHLH